MKKNIEMVFVFIFFGGRENEIQKIFTFQFWNFGKNEWTTFVHVDRMYRRVQYVYVWHGFHDDSVKSDSEGNFWKLESIRFL